jgi:hypothetical protein
MYTLQLLPVYLCFFNYCDATHISLIYIDLWFGFVWSFILWCWKSAQGELASSCKEDLNLINIFESSILDEETK